MGISSVVWSCYRFSRNLVTRTKVPVLMFKSAINFLKIAQYRYTFRTFKHLNRAFCENIYWIKAVNYFRKKLHLRDYLYEWDILPTRDVSPEWDTFHPAFTWKNIPLEWDIFHPSQPACLFLSSYITSIVYLFLDFAFISISNYQ